MPSYLLLAPEQGGNRFGPFQGGAINFGSDAQRCQITLALPGIAPMHATIMDHSDGTFTVSPTQRGLGLLLVQNGQHRQVDGPLKARSGDIVLIGGHTGAKFTLMFEAGNAAQRVKAMQGAGGQMGGYQGQPQVQQTQGNGKFAGGMFAGSSAARNYERQGGFGNAMTNEVKRQAMGRAMARLGLAQYAQLYYRFQSGSLLQPRFIVSALGGIVVLVGGAVVTCGGMVTTWWAANH